MERVGRSWWVYPAHKGREARQKMRCSTTKRVRSIYVIVEYRDLTKEIMLDGKDLASVFLLPRRYLLKA
jgi:hypothetical protein